MPTMGLINKAKIGEELLGHTISKLIQGYKGSTEEKEAHVTKSMTILQKIIKTDVGRN